MSHQQPIDEEAARAEAEAIAADVALWRRHQAAGNVLACTCVYSIGCSVLALPLRSLVMGGIAIPAAVGASFAWARVTARLDVTTTRLADRHYKHPIEVAALLEAASRGAPSGKVGERLARALSAMAPRQAQAFGDRQVRLLNSLLRVDPRGANQAGPELRIAALKVLAVVGDGHTAYRLEKLLGSNCGVRLEGAARACRAAIEKRLATGTDTLLRPTDAPADTLLRPAEGGADEETLLRPAEDRE